MWRPDLMSDDVPVKRFALNVLTPLNVFVPLSNVTFELKQLSDIDAAGNDSEVFTVNDGVLIDGAVIEPVLENVILEPPVVFPVAALTQRNNN
jgi:hypothetical protein